MKGGFTYLIHLIFELLTEPAPTKGMFIFKNRLIYVGDIPPFVGQIAQINNPRHEALD
jgi:hypothetical protein